MSITTEAMKHLDDHGWSAWVVEARISPTIKRDLFNIFDLLAVREGETLAIQLTSGSNHATRATKVRESPYLIAVKQAGWRTEVWSFKGRGTKAEPYVLRIEEV